MSFEMKYCYCNEIYFFSNIKMKCVVAELFQTIINRKTDINTDHISANARWNEHDYMRDQRILELVWACFQAEHIYAQAEKSFRCAH